LVGARSRHPARSLASRFPFLVLLGLGLHFPPTDFWGGGGGGAHGVVVGWGRRGGGG
jgi:hypothetical protein